MKKSIALVLSLLMLAGCFAGCTAAPAPAAEATDSTAATAQEAPQAAASDAAAASSSDMLVLQMFQGSSDRMQPSWFNVGTIASQCLFSRLLTLDVDSNPSCDVDSIAESFTVSDDYMTYEFLLKDGIKWHDGEALTAEDVKYSIEYAMRYGTVNTVLIGAFSCIEGCDALNAKTAEDISGITADGNKLTIKLASPTAFLLLSLGQFQILPKHAIEQYDPITFGTCDFWTWPIGSGPYKMKEFKANDYAILEKNADYFGNMAEIPLVKLGYFEEGDYVTLAQSGAIDYVQTMDLDAANEIAKLDTYTVKNVPIMYNHLLFWNSYGRGGNGGSPIADLNVRKALLHAIDRQAVVDSLLSGYGLVHDSLVSAASPNYNSDIYQFTYDPELAKSMLAEAGFDFSKTLRIATYYDNQMTANILDTLVYYFGQVGINAEWFVLTGDLVAGIYEVRDYDILYGDNSSMAPIEIYGNLSSAAGGYISKLFPTTPNPMDELIGAYKTTGDLDKQADILKQMQAKEAEMLYYMPLWTIDEFVVSNNRINGEITYGNEWCNYDRGLQDWTLTK